ncbi:unnamed protein product [Brassica oleracea var. botrytis]
MTTEIEPQSLQKLSLKSVKRALDLFSPAHDQLAPPDPESKKIRLSHKFQVAFGGVEPVSPEGANELQQGKALVVGPTLPPRSLNDNTVHAGKSTTILPAFGSSSERNVSTCALMPSRWPRPEWHAPWKNYRVIQGHLGWVRSVAFDPRNEWFCTGSADRTIKVWDVASGVLKLTLTGHIGQVRGLAVSNKDAYMFSAGDDKQVKCWDLEQNKVIRSYHGHLSGVYCLALHPTLDVLLTGGRDSVCRVWDIRTKMQNFALSGHDKDVCSVFTRPTDPQVVTGSHDSTIKFWDLRYGRTMTTLTNHKKAVRAMTLHPTENAFVSASADNIKKFSLPKGEFRHNMLSQQRATINAVAVNEDGVMVTGGDNGSLWFWDWKSGHSFQQAEAIVQPGSLESEAGIYAACYDQTGSRLSFTTEKLLGGQTRNGASKTKIVCTLGPASRSVEMIEKLLRAGMNVFNFSHGSHEYHQETLDNLRTAMQNTGILCAVMLDTKGPEIRTGFLKEGKPIELIQGQEITISIDYTIKGDSNVISMSYKKLAEDVKPGDVILCSDGTISLTVLSCDTYLGLVRCRCENSAVLGDQGVDLPTLTEKDKEDILQWGVPNKINIIALSFVRKGSDLDEVRELLRVHAKSIMLMSKVENQGGVANGDEIMEKTDAFMVARGDLGMEIPTWKIFRAQKKMTENFFFFFLKMTEKANALGKPIVTATQMLESMTKAPRPTRAENNVDDLQRGGGVSRLRSQAVALPLSTIESEAASVFLTAWKLNAKAIVVVTKGGYTAELVAKYRPSVPILTVVDQDRPCLEAAASVASHGLVYRGIVPVVATGASTEEKVRFEVEVAKKKEICKAGDLVVTFRMINGSSVVETLLVD